MKKLAPYLEAAKVDVKIYAFVLVAAVLTGVIAVITGQPGKFVPFVYMGGWISPALFGLSLYVTIAALLSIRALSPTRAFLARLRPSPDVVQNIPLFVAMVAFYGVFTSAKTLLPSIVPFHADPALAELDYWLHGGNEPWELLSFLMVPAITKVIAFLYSAIWLTTMVGTLALVVFAPALRAARTQYIWTFLLIWTVLGAIGAAVFMSAGPCFYLDVTGVDRYAELMRYIRSYDVGLGTPADTQDRLWRNYATGTAGLGTGISAFPSMHLANATLMALVWRRLHWTGGVVGVVFLMITLIGSVHLAWHYAVDGYVSILVTVAIWWGVGRVLKRRASRGQAPVHQGVSEEPAT